ncbi:MAG: LAGLIDADG family homing endonuclease [Nanoarchaeota archaeon]
MIELSPDILYLIEALKVEGYWSIKYREGAIQNKDLQFLRFIDNILKKCKVNTKKRILVKVRLQNLSDNVGLFDIHGNKIKYRWEKSPFSNKKKIVFNLAFRLSQKIKLVLGNVIIPITIIIHKNKIEVAGKQIEGWAYLDLRFYNTKFVRFLESVANKKNLSINFDTIKNSKDMTSIFSAIVDAEGNLVYYRFFRRISIRMKSKNYLEDVQKLLHLLHVNSTLSKIKNKAVRGDFFDLVIEGWEDINKLIKEGVDLKHSEKKKKLRIILESYKRNQISRNSSRKFYLDLIDDNPGITVRDLSTKTLKSTRVINHYLIRLYRKGLILREKKTGIKGLTYTYYPNTSRKH